MSWNTVAIEAYCFGKEKEGKYPCGKRYPDYGCLDNHICPHLAWSKSTERELSQFVPLWLIVKDRIVIWWDELYQNLNWILWGQLWFNQRKTREFFDNIKTVSAKDCPELAQWEEDEKKNQEEFIEWFKKVKELENGRLEI